MDNSTKGPWAIAMNSTCSAAWPVVVADDAVADEQIEVASLGTTHVFDYSRFDPAKVAATFDERPDLFVKHRDHDLQMANARRIVACVNACAGVPTEVLNLIAATPGGSFPERKLGDVLQLAVRRSEEQRDKLLGYLKVLLPLADEHITKELSDGAVGMSEALAALHAAQALAAELEA